MLLVNYSLDPEERKLFNEVDVGGEPVDDPNDDQNAGSDYTTPEPVNAAGADNTQTEEQPADDTPGGDEGAAEGGDTGDDEGDDDTDYTAEGGDEGGGDEGGDDTDYTDDAGGGDEGDTGGDTGGDTSGGGDGQVEADDARGMEEEIFKDLTKDQVDIKHKELKSNFTELYDSITNIIDRVNDIPNSDNYLQTITFVSNQLANLKQMVADYVNNVYSTKSYMENAMNYNRFLATLKGINDILEEISKESSAKPTK